MINKKTKIIIEKILTDNYNEYDLEYLLNLKNIDDINYLYNKANLVCDDVYGKAVFIRGIIEFSNICKKNCKYCGIRCSNIKKSNYRIDPDEIVKIASMAYNMGYRTIVLQSGEDDFFNNKLEYIIRAIKKQNDIAITLSVGEVKFELYEKWKIAGADRFLMRIETTDSDLFKKLHPDDELELRKSILFKLKELGYETGTGIMVGLPNQTNLSIAKDIMFFKELDADMLGIGPFIPHEDTPMKNEASGKIDDVLKVIAIIRLVLPSANIPATTAMGTLDPTGREKALKCGANVIMPNVTPSSYRPNYTLYNNKIGIIEESEESLATVKNIVESAEKNIKIHKGFRKK